MRKTFGVLILTILTAGAALADVLFLKNGSVLKGRFVGYENGKFIFETGGNRLEFRPVQVSRLVVERDDHRPPRDPNDPPSPPGRRWESLPPFDVIHEDQWHRSRIQVARGQRVKVYASGTIYLEGRRVTGPQGVQGYRDRDAPMPRENNGGLIAAIGKEPDSPPIFIGRSREFIADRDGVLYFKVNHGKSSGSRGKFSVTVDVYR
jgi:hypothetical protein